jgi:hypothetical protein
VVVFFVRRKSEERRRPILSPPGRFSSEINVYKNPTIKEE